MDNPFALIVEDDNSLATIYFNAMKEAEFEAEIVSDGKTALSRLAATTPSVVILDLHLPYVSGIEIFQQIRADERLANTRVVIMTADLFRAEPLRAEADMVLIKPIGFYQLRALATQLRQPETLE